MTAHGAHGIDGSGSRSRGIDSEGRGGVAINADCLGAVQKRDLVRKEGSTIATRVAEPQKEEADSKADPEGNLRAPSTWYFSRHASPQGTGTPKEGRQRAQIETFLVQLRFSASFG